MHRRSNVTVSVHRRYNVTDVLWLVYPRDVSRCVYIRGRQVTKLHKQLSIDKVHKLNLSRIQQSHIHTYTLIPQNETIVSLQYSLAYDITASSPKPLLRETLASGHQTGNLSTTRPLQFVVAVATAVRVVGDGYNHYHDDCYACLLYTSPSPRDHPSSRMPSSA